HFGAELCREIKGGRLGELRKAASFQGRTPRFWGSVEAIAGPEEWRLWGIPHCAKGEPIQLCPVSHGASPILVAGLQMSGKSVPRSKLASNNFEPGTWNLQLG